MVKNIAMFDTQVHHGNPNWDVGLVVIDVNSIELPKEYYKMKIVIILIQV
jgi:hypothetical protein